MLRKQGEQTRNFRHFTCNEKVEVKETYVKENEERVRVKTFLCLPKIVKNASIPFTHLRVSKFGFSSRVRST